MYRKRVMYLRIEATRRKMSDQLVAVVMTDDERAEGRLGSFGELGQLEEGAQCAFVGCGVVAAGRDPVVEMWKLRQQNRRLQCVEARILACDVDAIAITVAKRPEPS
jgi:hypothetical protein